MKRINLTMPEDWYDAFTTVAKHEGKTLSEWLRDAGHAKLPKQMRKELSEPAPVGRPIKLATAGL